MSTTPSSGHMHDEIAFGVGRPDVQQIDPDPAEVSVVSPSMTVVGGVRTTSEKSKGANSCDEIRQMLRRIGHHPNGLGSLRSEARRSARRTRDGR